MPTLAAGASISLTLPAGSALTLSGYGTYQAAPGGPRELRDMRPVVVNAKIDPLPVAATINLTAISDIAYTLGNNVAFSGNVAVISASRAATPDDNGKTLVFTGAATYTIGPGLPDGWGVAVEVRSGIATMAFTGGAQGRGAAASAYAATSIARDGSTVWRFDVLNTGPNQYAVSGA